jgi:hypothetical protein
MPTLGWPLEVVISGGQTGADQAGICAAKFLNYTTGGYATQRFETEHGLEPWLAEFGLRPVTSGGYKSRTYANITHSDATVIFTADCLLPRTAREKKHYRTATDSLAGYTIDQLMTAQGVTTPGSQYTFRLAIANRKHLMVNPLEAEPFRMWINNSRIKTLNVAGCRESLAPGIYRWVYDFLVDAMVPF